MTIHGMYWSRYQGLMIESTVEKLIAQEVGFVGIRLTSGAGYIDPVWERNASMLRDTNILLSPWHFVTLDKPDAQYKNFIKQVEKFDHWRLPPWLDCEAFTQAGNFAFGVHELQAYPEARHTFASFKLASGDLHHAFSPDGQEFGLWSTFGLSYPSEATVDAIGRWLTAWMGGQQLLRTYPYPAIYTNEASGNKVFKTPTMKRYPLIVANWNTPGKPPLTSPAMPAVWKGAPWYRWQDGIVDGAPYGIDGQVDHQVWGDLYPFPGSPEPEPEPGAYIELTGTGSDGSKWAGRLTEA